MRNPTKSVVFGDEHLTHRASYPGMHTSGGTTLWTRMLSIVPTTLTGVEWDRRTLEGRLDLLLKDTSGNDVVLDLKWGSTTYADKLEVGAAIQLATYAFVRRQQTQAKRLPVAGYYSLRKAEAIALSDDTFPDARVIEGPDLELTWKRTTATLTAIEDDVMSGCIAAPGTQPETPAWQLGAQGKAKPDRFVPLPTESACEYCSLDSICGKRWQGVEGGDL